MAEEDLVNGRSSFGGSEYDDDAISVDNESLLYEAYQDFKLRTYKLTDEVKSLKAQLIASEENNVSLLAELDRYAKRKKKEQNLINDLHECETKNEALNETVAYFQDQVTKFNKQLVENWKEISQYKKQINELNNEIEKKTLYIASFEKSNAELKERFQKCNADKIELENKLSEAEETIKTLQEPALEMEQKIADQRSLIQHLTFEKEILVRNKEEPITSPFLKHLKESQFFQSKSGTSNFIPNLSPGSILMHYKCKRQSAENRSVHFDCGSLRNNTLDQSIDFSSITMKPGRLLSPICNTPEPIKLKISANKQRDSIANVDLNMNKTDISADCLNRSFDSVLQRTVKSINTDCLNRSDPLIKPNYIQGNHFYDPSTTISSEEEFMLLSSIHSNQECRSLKSELSEVIRCPSPEEHTKYQNNIQQLETKIIKLESDLSDHNKCVETIKRLESKVSELQINLEKKESHMSEIENMLTIEMWKSSNFIAQLNNVSLEKRNLETHLEYLRRQMAEIDNKGKLLMSHEQIDYFGEKIYDAEYLLDIERLKSTQLVCQLKEIIEDKSVDGDIDSMKQKMMLVLNSSSSSDTCIHEKKMLNEKIETLEQMLADEKYRFQEEMKVWKLCVYKETEKLDQLTDNVMKKIKKIKQFSNIDACLSAVGEIIHLSPDVEWNKSMHGILRCSQFLEILDGFNFSEVTYADAEVQVRIYNDSHDSSSEPKDLKKLILKPPTLLLNRRDTFQTSTPRQQRSKFTATTSIGYRRISDSDMNALAEISPVQIGTKLMDDSSNHLSTEQNNNIENDNSARHSAGWTEFGEIADISITEEICTLLTKTMISSPTKCGDTQTVSVDVEPVPPEHRLIPVLPNEKRDIVEMYTNGDSHEKPADHTPPLEHHLTPPPSDDNLINSETFTKLTDNTDRQQSLKLCSGSRERTPDRQESDDISISVLSTSSGSSESFSLDNEFVARCPGDDIKRGGRKLSAKEEQQEGGENGDEKNLLLRSCSQPASETSTDFQNEEIDVFPSITDRMLEELGLLKDDQFGDPPAFDETEMKYRVLTLAFATDGATLQTRQQRLKRRREQSEDNLATEIARLVTKINRLHPLCVDAEKTELVTSLIAQVDILIRASTQVSTSSEMYGAVQQEWRLSDAIACITAHVESLKQQRDTARRQLQCTKRMLQNSTSVECVKATNIRQKSVSAYNVTTGNRMTARRASIAAISRLPGNNEPQRPFMRPQIPTSLSLDLARRSKLPERLSPSRSSLSPRSEHGRELLQHIREYSESIEAASEQDVQESSELVAVIGTTEISAMRQIVSTIRDTFCSYVDDGFHARGFLYNVCRTGAIIFFSIVLWILSTVLYEYYLSKANRRVAQIPWKWMTWEEVFNTFFRIDRTGVPPT